MSSYSSQLTVQLRSLYLITLCISLTYATKLHALPHSILPTERNTEWSHVRRSITRMSASNGFHMHESNQRQLLMINGSADDAFIVNCNPEPGFNMSMYHFSFKSDNSRVINESVDVTWSQMAALSGVNISVLVDFVNFPGRVTLSMEARRTVDDSLYDSMHVSYIAAGLAIFDRKTQKIISGTEKSLIIESYKQIYETWHWDFGVYVQYLNGSDSNTPIGASKSAADSFHYTDIAASIHGSGLLLWDHDVCSVVGGTWNGNTTVLSDGCGMGFAISSPDRRQSELAHFAMDFERNRGGPCFIFFEWKGFTFNTLFQGEEYTNLIIIEIGGRPPAVVRRIEPSNPFSKNGGERLHVEMINTADVNITSFNVNHLKFPVIPEGRQLFSNSDNVYETVSFLTESGSGKNLSWTISGTRRLSPEATPESVDFLDETGFLFSYDDDDVLLKEIRPNVTSENGGNKILLLGNFASFALDSEHHQVLLGGVLLDRRYYTSASSTQIEFRAPPHVKVGRERVVQIQVQIENSFSNKLTLTYVPISLNVTGYVFGASYDDQSQTYILSSCGNTTFAVIGENYDDGDTSFSWKVFDESLSNLLPETKLYPFHNGSNSLELPNSVFESYDVPYSVMAEITVRDISTSFGFIVQRSRNIVAGVTLITPEDRFISSPSVDMRVIAKVDVPACFKDPTDLMYEWNYQESDSRFRSFLFSFHNDSVSADDEISPTRLGRELVVPRERLSYGFHRISLTVRDRNQTRFFGKATSGINILKSPLQAIIGNGSSSLTVSDAEPLVISGRLSFDPDSIVRSDKGRNFTFSWTCAISFVSNFSTADSCTETLLPSNAGEEFVILSKSLKEMTESFKEEDGKVYIHYTLKLKGKGRLGETSQTVMVLKSNNEKAAQVQQILIVDAVGEPIDTENVKFWEDVFIRPQAANQTQWMFRLLSPYTEVARFLQETQHEISTANYYKTAGNGDPKFQRLPLRLSSDKLSPNRVYEISITFREDGKISTEMFFRLRTLERPRMVFPSLRQSYGDVGTTFRAMAITSFTTNGMYIFQFYLIDRGQPEFEYCVDGCSGSNFVTFKVSKPGEYILQCRILAADGKRILSTRDNERILNISSSSLFEATPKVASDLMRKDFRRGDDGSVCQRGYFAVQAMLEEQADTDGNPTNEMHNKCANFAKTWASEVHQIVRKDIPNSANAQNYVRVAVNFARLRCIEQEETLYSLLGIVHESITRIPPEESLTISTSVNFTGTSNSNLHVDVVNFYNLTMASALSIQAGGSSRDRLVSIHGEVNNIILDLGEMWTSHMAMTTASGRECGWEATFTSQIPDRMLGLSFVPPKDIPPVGVNTMKVALRCTAEQGQSLRTPFGSFDWCNAVYALTGSERKIITLTETFDYPFYSGVQGQNSSDSARLVLVDISTSGSSIRVMNSLSESMIAAQAAETESGSCYHIGMKLLPENNLRSGRGSINRPFLMRPRKLYGEMLSSKFERAMYGRRRSEIFVTPESRNSTDNVVAMSNALGLYGVERWDNRSAIDRLNESLEGTGLVLFGLLVGIILLLIIIILSVFVIISFILSLREQPPVQTTQVYVERDYHGRLQVESTESTSAATGNSLSPAASQTRGYPSRNQRGGDNDMLGVEDMLGLSRRASPGRNGLR